MTPPKENEGSNLAALVVRDLCSDLLWLGDLGEVHVLHVYAADRASTVGPGDIGESGRGRVSRVQSRAVVVITRVALLHARVVLRWLRYHGCADCDRG